MTNSNVRAGKSCGPSPRGLRLEIVLMIVGLLAYLCVNLYYGFCSTAFWNRSGWGRFGYGAICIVFILLVVHAACTGRKAGGFKGWRIFSAQARRLMWWQAVIGAGAMVFFYSRLAPELALMPKLQKDHAFKRDMIVLSGMVMLSGVIASLLIEPLRYKSRLLEEGQLTGPDPDSRVHQGSDEAQISS